MAWLSSLNPINSFPDYHGPYEVGTVDVEIPTDDLPSPAEMPKDAQPTIAFRIFYPCVKPSRSGVDRPVRWIPQPQRMSMVALMEFLGMRERTASMFSHLPQQLYYINLRAHRNAALLEPPTSNGRWPVAVFSHGLAGSRNAYSYICGDLASNGMVVIALDHRDGSSPIQYVRATPKTEPRIVSTVKIRHDPCDEVWEARDKQLRIRLWEISKAYEALLKIDAGEEVENLDSNTSRRRKERVEVLQRFHNKLDIHRAGKVSWIGHSFGAATITQLLKSVYYSNERPSTGGKALLTPKPDSAILRQITPESPTALLDMWCLPLKSPQQAFLRDRPLPCNTADESIGCNLISILSESFADWKPNVEFTKSIIAPPLRSGCSVASPLAPHQRKLLPEQARLRDESITHDSGYVSQDTHSSEHSPSRPQSNSVGRLQKSTGPHMFYVEKSQHFNQSDFGILFPWLARRLTKAEEPERILELNNRAIIEMMREAGIEVAGENDSKILRKEDSVVRRWIHVPLDDEKDTTMLEQVNRKLSVSEIEKPMATTQEVNA